MPWLVKSCNRRQLTREERTANYRISRGRRLVENAFAILLSRFRVILGTMEQRPKVVRDIVLTCMVLHNMLRTHQGRAERAPTPIDYIGALQNEQVVCVPDDNYRNPLKEAKHQRDLLKDYFKEAGTYQSFSGLPNHINKFYLCLCLFQQIKKKSFPTSFQTISKDLTSLIITATQVMYKCPILKLKFCKASKRYLFH